MNSFDLSLIILCGAMGVINIIALFGWYKESKKTQWYDQRCDILVTVLLRYMRKHNCPMPNDNMAELEVLVNRTVYERIPEARDEKEAIP